MVLTGDWGVLWERQDLGEQLKCSCLWGCPEPPFPWHQGCAGRQSSSGARCLLHHLGPSCVPRVPLFVHCSRSHCSGDRTTSGAKITGMWQISLSPRLGQLTSELQLLQFLFPPAGAWEPVIYAHTCIFPGLWPRACLHPAKLKWMISKPDTHEYNPYLCENFHKPKLFTAIALAVPLIALAM